MSGLRAARFQFPFLFGRAFIEAALEGLDGFGIPEFPFLFGRAFIEATLFGGLRQGRQHFPSFLEGLSLRRLAPEQAAELT